MKNTLHNTSVFWNENDRATAERWRLSGDTDREQRRQQGLHLRWQHEQATKLLQELLPFRWQPGIRKPRYVGERFFPEALPAVHIMLLEPHEQPGLSRAAGDWLCRPALDTDTGEIRYEGEKAPQYADGSGGPAAYYEQQPTCKNCLKWAQNLMHG